LPIFAESCKKHAITGLILVGDTQTLTDGAHLTEYFLKNDLSTKVVVIPSALDGNIRHGLIETSLGFDTVSGLYSALIGNILTDTASGFKYWNFIRVMGSHPSHVALECALKTHPNMVIISEEAASKGETLEDIVNRVADVVCERAAEGKNYGAVVIPEGLLANISAFKHLFIELNELFMNCDNDNKKE